MMKFRTAAHSGLLVALLALSACDKPPAPKVTSTPPNDLVAHSKSVGSAKLSAASDVQPVWRGNVLSQKYV